jgi:hypothetical protein
MSSYHAEAAGAITVRTSWDPDASMLAVICGPDLEGHADRAPGTWMLWAGGEFLVTTGKLHVGNGVSTQATQFHNVILVDGRGLDAPDSTLQKPPGRIHAFDDTESHTRIRMEAGGAYHRRKWPSPEVVLKAWWRELLWFKPGFILCSDRVEKVRAEQVITWQIHLPHQPITDGKTWVVAGEKAILTIDFLGNSDYRVELERVPDTTMGGPGCWRLKRIAPAGKLVDEFNALLQVRL